MTVLDNWQREEPYVRRKTLRGVVVDSLASWQLQPCRWGQYLDGWIQRMAKIAWNSPGEVKSFVRRASETSTRTTMDLANTFSLRHLCNRTSMIFSLCIWPVLGWNRKSSILPDKMALLVGRQMTCVDCGSLEALEGIWSDLQVTWSAPRTLKVLRR